MYRRIRAHAKSACAVLVGTFAISSSAAAQGAIPTPESVLGFTVGADYKLATYDESIRYFERLAAVEHPHQAHRRRQDLHGPRVDARRISSSPGKPGEARPLPRHRAAARAPEGLTDDQAHALAREGRAFVDISGGLHASEIAGSQHTIQLAYDILAHADDPKINTILDNTVLFLWPSINPDGQNIVVNWYRENVGTPYEISPLHELYQKYLGHDNNRDAYMLNVVESRVVARTWRQWEPTVIYVQHQTAPFPTRIWLPPFAEPIAPRVNALMSREVNTIGMTIAQELETNGQVGATHMGTGFDAWYPGYIDYMPMLQNIASFWTETALYQYATPHFYTIRDFPERISGSPPAVALSEPVARRMVALEGRRRLHAHRVDGGARLRHEVPRRTSLESLPGRPQRDRRNTATIRRMRISFRSSSAIPARPRKCCAASRSTACASASSTRKAAHDGVKYPAGTWVIPMDQEYAELVRQLFEPQEYPDLREYPEGPPEQPYDAAGWTLPYQMDVTRRRGTQPLSAEFRAALKPVQGKAVDWHNAPDAPFNDECRGRGNHSAAGQDHRCR